jgi:hypothetical protein
MMSLRARTPFAAARSARSISSNQTLQFVENEGAGLLKTPD